MSRRLPFDPAITAWNCVLLLVQSADYRSVLLFVLIAWSHVSTARAQVPTLNEIATTWQKREALIKSARVSWTKELFVGEHNPMTDHTTANDSTPTFDAMQVELSVVGQMFRLETPIPTSEGTLKKMVHTFDGSLNTMLVTAESSDDKSGAIGAEKYFYDLKDIHLRPVLMYLRPLHPQLIKLGSDNSSIRDRRERVNGRECIVLVQQAPDVPELSEIYWLDPKQDFLPLQWQERYNGLTTATVQLAYGRNSDGALIPESWRCAFFDLKGAFREGSRASSVTVDLNEPIDRADFSLALPEGTVVGDRRQHGEQFVVASDGSLRPLGVDGPASPVLFPIARWVILLVLVVATLLVGGFLYRRKGS